MAFGKYTLEEVKEKQARKMAQVREKRQKATKLGKSPKNVGKVAKQAKKPPKKTTRAKKMEMKRKLCEQYELPIIPCSRWGTAKSPTRTDLLRGMLWHVFSAYIRKRDYDKNCITCNKPLNGDIQAGHYVPVGDSSVAMWFREDNVHGEHANCNANWNDWHLVPMRKNLVALYGEDHVAEMDTYVGRKSVADWDEQDYVDKIKHYLALI